MTARMHLALAEAFGRRSANVQSWAEGIEATIALLAPGLLDRSDVADTLAELCAVKDDCLAIRTHGDFHLGRVYRTEQGWYVGDLDPGGAPSTRAGIVDDSGVEPIEPVEPVEPVVPVFRSPVADVADMLWSFGNVATNAADERDPTGCDGLVELAVAWEQRNRSSFLGGYLDVPGIGELVPPVEEAVRAMASAFELERTARRIAERQ